MIRILSTIILMLCLTFPSTTLLAAGYPDKPVTLVAPYGAGALPTLSPGLWLKRRAVISVISRLSLSTSPVTGA